MHLEDIKDIIRFKKYESVHYFGLGFIQMKLNKYERLHFYIDNYPRTSEIEEIHNHRYNFVSQILLGTLYQQIYDIELNVTGKYTLVSGDCKEGVDLIKGKSYDIKEIYYGQYNSNDSYYIDHNTFHRVESNLAITYIKRGDYKKELADVIHYKNKNITCPFSIKIKEEDLLDRIKEMLYETD